LRGLSQTSRVLNCACRRHALHNFLKRSWHGPSRAAVEFLSLLSADVGAEGRCRIVFAQILNSIVCTVSRPALAAADEERSSGTAEWKGHADCLRARRGPLCHVLLESLISHVYVS